MILTLKAMPSIFLNNSFNFASAKKKKTFYPQRNFQILISQYAESGTHSTEYIKNKTDKLN